MSHFVKQCVHGVVVSTCRCVSHDKEVRVVPCPAKCKSRYEPKYAAEPVTFAPIDDVLRGLATVVPHTFVPDPNMGPQDSDKPMVCRACECPYTDEVHVR